MAPKRNAYSLDDPFGMADSATGLPQPQQMPAFGGGTGQPGPTRNPYSLVPGGGTNTIPATAYATPPQQLTRMQAQTQTQVQPEFFAPPNRNNDPSTPPPPPPPPPPAPPSNTEDANGYVAVWNDPQSSKNRGISPAQYVQNWQQQWGGQLPPNPQNLKILINSMRSQGYNATFANHNGQHSDDKIDFGDGTSADVIRSSGGPDAAWVWQGTYNTAGGGNEDNSLNLGTTNMDPNAALTESMLARIIGNYGSTPFGQDIQKQLATIISSGGVAPGMENDLINAREAEATARGAMMNDARADLANRGTLSEPGLVQGPNEEAVANVDRAIAPGYSAAVRDIVTHNADLKQQSLMSALTIATGMSEAQANTMLNAIGQGTNRTTALANIALGLLRENREWNQFLATHGLDQAKLEWDIKNGNMQNIIELLKVFVAQGGTLSQGYIDNLISQH